MTTFRRSLLAAFAVLSLGPMTHLATLQAQASDLTVSDAWVRASGARPVTAAYAVLENTGSADRTIVSAASPVAKSVELHEMKMQDGMMRMSPVKQIVVPAKGKVSLRPGGLHVMLFGVTNALKPGERIPLTFQFQDGTAVTTSAEVRAEAGMRGDGKPGMKPEGAAEHKPSDTSGGK